MGCCGQARAAYAQAYAPPPPGPRDVADGDESAAAPAPAAAPAAGRVRLQFTRQAGVRVRGLVSGATYAFSGDAPVQAVDARDADALLRSGYFRRAY